MTTNFTLTKKVKEKLVYDLTAKAVEKKMKALEAKLVKLNTEFWVEHDKRVADVLQIDPKRYDELIQIGALVPVKSIEARNLTGAEFRADRETIDLGHEIVRRMQSKLSTLIYGGYSRSRCNIVFVNNYSVPTIDRKNLELADRPSCNIYKKADELLGQYINIIESAREFRSDAASIIMPIRSYRVLLEHFPEAAKLLTPPAKASSNIIPVEAINDVRERLKAGIPA